MTGGPPARVRRMRRRTIGEPSDSNCNSYLPFLFVALHEILETCCDARLPISLAVPCRSLDGVHRQAVELRPVAGFELHLVDRQFVQIILRPNAMVAGEGDDVARIRRIIQRDGKIGPAFFGLEEADGPALEITSGDLERRALAGHQREHNRVLAFGLGLIGGWTSAAAKGCRAPVRQRTPLRTASRRQAAAGGAQPFLIGLEFALKTSLRAFFEFEMSPTVASVKGRKRGEPES